MNKIVLSFLALLCCINIQAGVKLQKQGSATQLVVNDKPMLLLAGDLNLPLPLPLSANVC